MNQYFNQNRRDLQQSEKKELLLKIMKNDFILVDLQLYLDNHPNCLAAVEEFNQHSRISLELKEQYHRMYGPLMNYGYMDSEIPWQWIDEPWPWEKKYMCEM